MTREEARMIFLEMTESASLRRHARTVELVMEALALRFNGDPDQWAITGLLHDADYEKHPEEHPQVIVEKLNALGEHEIAHAIAGHYTKWNVSRITTLDRAIVAADELTGFIVAVALIRPARLTGLEVQTVLKKLRTPTFAAKVDRDEVTRGAELIGWPLEDLIAFIIDVLDKNRSELGLDPV